MWFKLHLPGAVDVGVAVAVGVAVSVSDVILFLLLMHFFFQEASNKNETKGYLLKIGT